MALPPSGALLARLSPRLESRGVSFAVTPAADRDRSFAEREPQPAPLLHTNACGDFTLPARDDWFDLRGCPELDMYSINLDSALCFAASLAGIDEVLLSARVYHIEHSAGSGFTPQGRQQLWDRLRARGVGWLDWETLCWSARQARRLGSTMIFNCSDWGLGDLDLPQMILSRSTAGAASGGDDRARAH